MTNTINIVLTGMMGCGKSTIAKKLSEKLPNFKLIETDELIIKTEKKSINEIFKTQGEAYFRQKETELLTQLKDQDKLIISTGGGMFVNHKNQELLKSSFSVYLSATVETIYNRVKMDTKRPLLNCDNLKEKIKKLISERELEYQKATCEIKTDDKQPEKIADEILEKYKNHGN